MKTMRSEHKLLLILIAIAVILTIAQPAEATEVQQKVEWSYSDMS